MTDIAVYLDRVVRQTLHDDKNVGFSDAYELCVRNLVSRKVRKELHSSSGAIYFRVLPAINPSYDRVWFVGAIAIKKVFSNYFVALLKGGFATGDASEYRDMEKQAQEIYTRHADIMEELENIIYNTSPRAIESPMLWSIPDFDNQVDIPQSRGSI